MKHFNHEKILAKKCRSLFKKEAIPSYLLNFPQRSLRRQFYLSLLLCLSLFTNTFAQETWTGAVDGDWSKNANWLDNSAPLSGIIASDGILTIQGGAINPPSVNIPTTITAKQLMVMSSFTIPTGVTVEVDNEVGPGDAVVTSLSGTNLTVHGTLNVNNAQGNGLTIGQDGTQLFNFGTISVNGSNAAGMVLTGSGASVNSGNLTILNSGTTGLSLLANASPANSFDNRNCLLINDSGGDAINSQTNFENSNKVTIADAGGNGINNTGVFINDSLANLTINEIVGDGIITDSIFNNDGGTITIGNGNLGDIGNHGINIAGGTFNNNNSTVSQSGGMITINGVAGDGINNTGLLENGGVTGDSIGVIMIDNINGNGINLNDGSVLLNRIGSSILIGQKGTVKLHAIRGSVTATIETNGTITALGSIDLMNLYTNMPGSTLTIDQATDFAGGLVNNGIIKSSAPANSVTVTGTFTNNGIIIDPNNSFGIDRDNITGIMNDGGVIIIPDTMMCYTDTITPFLITGSTQPDTLPYLPSPTFTMAGNQSAATFDAANNQLVLNEVQSLMNFSFEILHNGVSTGQTCSTSLSFDNLPNTFLACVGNLQVTLINDCQATLKPSDLLQGNLQCNDGYQIGIVGSTMGDSLILTPAHIGQTVSVMVTNPLGNSCWTSLLVEDKTAPICQNLRDTTYFCGQKYDPVSLNAYPIVTDVCSAIVDTTYSDDYPSNFLDCGNNIDDPDTLKHIQRTWRFTDASGNSTSCVQNIYELKPTLAMVQFPDSLVGATALNCVDGPYLGRVGAPYVVVGTDTVLVSNLCRFGLDFSDNILNINSANKQRISRTWFVTDWCNSNAGQRIAIGEQLIEVVDNTAPTFTTPLASSVVVNGTANHNCAVDIIVPPLTNLADECAATSDLTVTIIGPSNTIFGNGGTMPSVPFGTHDIIYLVEDPSGNVKRDTIAVTVDDILPPVAIGQEVAITLIDASVVTWAYATSFDGGSHDNCGIDSFLVRKSRVDTFTNRIGFNCFDLGLDTVVIRVVDTAGNVSMSWALARVEDKQGFCVHDNDNAPTRWEDLNNDNDPTNDFTIPGTAIPDYLNPDDDGDGVLTKYENPDPNGDGDISDAQDTDGDGIPDFRDIDDDNDGIWTIHEFNNEDNDENTIANAIDTNNDGVPNYLDKDDDGDSIFTEFEAANPVNGIPTVPRDTDDNGIPDYLDDDDDGDKIATRFEGVDANNDGNPDDAKDSNDNGTPDYLEFLIMLTESATIAGHIQNEKGDMVEAVNISIGGYEMAPATTSTNGTFSFEEIPLNGSYMITPEKDMNYANGITTFDIVLLSKHVLGIKPLDSPYKLIAADVNHSGSISAYDMVLLRQVILGMKEDFPNNTSWRFIDADYDFFNPENPFIEKYPEAYEITNLAGDMMTLDFVAVKIGDLNNSAAANQFMTAESRNTTTALNFEITEQVKKAGETVTIDFKASNFEEILGYQFGVDFNGHALAFEQLLIGNKMSFENFNLSMLQRGVITTSWNEAEAVNIDANEVLFSLVFKAKENLRLSEVIQLGSNITPAEAYTGTEEIIAVNLEIATATTLDAGVKLYQNKPNPFTGETLIGFDLPTAATATMTILDMSGKVVKVIKGEYDKGYNQININGKAFTEHGMFYYQLATQNGVETKKMILLKQ